MNYQVVKFEYKHFSYSKAEVVHWPNWFERLLRKRAVVVQYKGFVDYWVRTDTFDKAPYSLRNALLTEWHNHDLAHFKKEVAPKVADLIKKFIQLLKNGHADNN